MDAPVEPAYLTVEEARQYLRASRNFLYRLIQYGEIASVKRGKRRLVVLRSLREYAERESVEKAV